MGQRSLLNGQFYSRPSAPFLLVATIASLSLIFFQVNSIDTQALTQDREPHLLPKSIAQQAEANNDTTKQPGESFFNLRSFFTNFTGNNQQQPSLTSQQQKSPFSDRKCLMCRFSVSLINYALKTRRGYDHIDRIANSFCSAAHLESPLVCSKVSKLFNHEITKVITYGIVTPDQVCGLISNNSCGHFHSPLDDWEVNLNASHLIQPPNKIEGSKSEQLKIEDSTPPFRVIHLSDTHIDLKYQPGTSVNCREPLCCQNTSTPLNATLSSSAGYWGSYGPCDIPLRTFEATLKFIKSMMAESKDIEYIIWTGDIQPHDVWAQTKKSANNLYDQVFALIFQHLPNVKILPALGNHEMIPVDSFSPSNLLEIARDDSPLWLYKKLDSFWSRWLPKDTVNTITRDGFYATNIRKGLKAISLNTNFCHSKNFWLFINSTDPGNQLQWLVHELQISELIGEKVHIIGHIPPGSDDCMKVWSRNYNRILRRFAQTITGQFFGHTHNNEFEVFYELEAVSKVASSNETQQAEDTKAIEPKAHTITSMAMLTSLVQNTSNSVLVAAATKPSTQDDNLKPIGVGFIGPSVTTFVNLNPGLRIYSIDPKRGFMPTDFETLFINLTHANANITYEPEWTSAGMFSRVFNINDTSPESLHGLLKSIADDFDDSDEEAGGDSDATNNEEGDKTDEGEIESVSNSTANVVTREREEDKKATNETSSGGGDDDDDEADGDDRLFELHWLYNSYSDTFNRSVYDLMTAEEKRKFLCRWFTGQSHEALPCDEFVPTVTVFKIAPDLVQV